jgi:Zn-dependent protease with chaperone function
LAILGLSYVSLGPIGLIVGILILIVIPQIAIKVVMRRMQSMLRSREPTTQEAEQLREALKLLDLTHAPQEILFEIITNPRPTAGVLNGSKGTVRIVISESMMTLASNAQAAAFIAHELGHHYCPNNWSIQWVMMPTKVLMKVFTTPYRHGPLGRLLSSILRFLFVPFEWLFAFSTRENEHSADAFVHTLGGDADEFCDLLTSTLKEHELMDVSHGRRPFSRDRNGPLRPHPSVTERIAQMCKVT